MAVVEGAGFGAVAMDFDRRFLQATSILLGRKPAAGATPSPMVGPRCRVEGELLDAGSNETVTGTKPDGATLKHDFAGGEGGQAALAALR